MRAAAAKKTGKKRHLFGTSLEKRRARAGYVFIIPLILGVVFLFIPNLIQTFQFTVNNIEIVEDGYRLNPVGFYYFKQAVTVNPLFNKYLILSLQELVTDIPVITIFSMFIATLLNQRFRGRIFALAVFFIPVLLATGIVARVETTSKIMDFAGSGALSTGTGLDSLQLNGLNELLLGLNFSPTLISIISGAANGIYGVIQASGIQIFIFLAGLQEIPEPIYEAASVEGCTQWEAFWKITIPMVSPQIAVCFIYTVVDAFTREDSALFSYIKELAFGQNQYAYANAMYMIYLGCIAVLLGIIGLLLSRLVRYND